MPIRDENTPSPTELDRLAEITEADVEDAAASLKRRVPQAKRAVDAVESDKGAEGPIADA